jgi:hypothetical protein
MANTTLLKIELISSSYISPNSDDPEKSDARLFEILVTGASGETNVYLMEEAFWDKLEPKIRKLIKKFFVETNKEVKKV